MTANSISSTGGIGTLVALALMILAAMVVALALMGLAGTETATVTLSSRASTTSSWIEGQNARIRDDLVIQSHATKHGTETWDIYAMLLEGKCAASTTFCGGSDIEEMHICIDPVTGIVGAVLQFGDDITTGYWERDGSGYWRKRVAHEGWEVCR